MGLKRSANTLRSSLRVRLAPAVLSEPDLFQPIRHRCPGTPSFALLGGLLVRLSASTSFRVRQRVDNSDVLELKSRVGLTHALASLLKAFARVSRGDIRLDGVEDTTRRDP